MSAEIARVVEKVTAPLSRRLRLMVLRAVVKMVQDEGKFQRVQLAKLAGVDDDDIENLQPYGFWSVPLPGAEALVFSIGGMSDNAVVGVVADRRFRPTGHEPGESGLHFKNTVLVRCAGPDNAPEVHLGANEATDSVSVASKVEAEFARIYDAFATWVPAPVALDGGSAVAGQIKALMATAASAKQPVGSSNVKVKP